MKKNAEILNTLLADEITIYQQLRHYHWNVRGEHFFNLHVLFEKQYDEVEEIIDELAERVRSIGFDAIGTFDTIQKRARVPKHTEKMPSWKKMVEELRDAHDLIVQSAKADAEKLASMGDTLNEDLLIGIAQKHQKMAWMLGSTLE